MKIFLFSFGVMWSVLSFFGFDSFFFLLAVVKLNNSPFFYMAPINGQLHLPLFTPSGSESMPRGKILGDGKFWVVSPFSSSWGGSILNKWSKIAPTFATSLSLSLGMEFLLFFGLSFIRSISTFFNSTFCDRRSLCLCPVPVNSFMNLGLSSFGKNAKLLMSCVTLFTFAIFSSKSFSSVFSNSDSRLMAPESEIFAFVWCGTQMLKDC